VAEFEDVYYRIYQFESIGWKLTVVAVQYFDEKDYHEDRFMTDDNGDKLRFELEEDAIKWLNDNIKTEMIDPEYLLSGGFKREDYFK